MTTKRFSPDVSQRLRENNPHVKQAIREVKDFLNKKRVEFRKRGIDLDTEIKKMKEDMAKSPRETGWRGEK